MQVQLTADKWEQYGSIYVRGRYYQQTKPCGLSLLAQQLDACTSITEVVVCLQAARGDFSVVINKPQFTCIAVGHTRLYPLFYRQADGHWHVSDDPLLLLQAGDVVNESARKQYLYTGAPFAGKTLVAAIQQCKPAYVTLLGKAEVKEQSLGPYAALPMGTILAADAEVAFANVLRVVFERVVQVVGSRQVVIPLSGGYDSRLVLSMLHQMGIKNILCYTVGEYHPSEQGVAHQVAKNLQVPLYHIDYRDAQYRMQQFDSPAFLQYVDAIGAMGNFMWLFEYNAILWLKQQGLLQNDAVFIPGHVGDFYAGSHLQKLGINEHDSLSAIQRKLLLHAFEYRKSYFDTSFKKEVKQALHALSRQGAPYQTALQFIAENRLAHQIINSARVYECLGYDVLLPLCDVDFVQFFDRLPYKQRADVSFYNEYLLQKVFLPLNIAFKKPLNAKNLQKQRLKNALKLLIPRRLYLRFKHRTDLTTETYLLHEMFDELVQKGMASTPTDYACGNELMLNWYLKRVEMQLNF